MTLRRSTWFIACVLAAVLSGGDANAARHHHIVVEAEQHALHGPVTDGALSGYAPDVDIVYGRAEVRSAGAEIFQALEASGWRPESADAGVQYAPWGIKDLRNDGLFVSQDLQPAASDVQPHHAILCTLEQAESSAVAWANRIDAIFVDMGPYQTDILRPEAVDRLKPIAEAIKQANRDCWVGVRLSTDPDHLDAHEEHGARSALRLFADTAFWVNAYMIPVTRADTAAPEADARPYFAQIMDGIIEWDARPEEGMYAETFRPPDVPLNRDSELLMQRSAMVGGAITIAAAILITWRYKPRSQSR